MRINWLYGALAGLGLMLGSEQALADGMHCGNRIISSGDSLYEVKSRCGPPQDADRRVETRTERRRVRAPCAHRRGTGARCERELEYSVEVVIDEWTYDFGPRRFVRYLTFVDGKLARVETGSYGTDR